MENKNVFREKKEVASLTRQNVALMVKHKVLAKLNNKESNKYLNVFREKKEKATFDKNVALRVMLNLSKDYDIDNDNKYLNVSIFYNFVEEASVALKVMHQIDTLGLVQRLPGSNPGWGASTFKTVFEIINSTINFTTTSYTPTINTLNSTDLTITSSGGSVIIQLGA